MSLPEPGCDCTVCRLASRYGPQPFEQYAQQVTTKNGAAMGADTQKLLERCMNACAFYIELHRAEKQTWLDYDEKECLTGVYRNFSDFIQAIGDDNRREMLAEGIGIVNHIFFLLDLHCKEELDKVQDWPAILEEARK